jgi:hypothetical protein
MNIPPPLIPPTGNFSSISLNSMKSGSIFSGQSEIGFFGNVPTTQQLGAPTRNNNGEYSDHDMLISIVNTLNNYGLMNYSTVYSGRTLTFINNTTDSPSLELYVTVGGKGNTLTSLGVFQGTGESHAIVYEIPTTIGWTGNFQIWPVGFLPTNQLGATLFEISVNDQVYNSQGQLLPLRDNWDISTVPPYLPVPQLDCGPRAQAVAVSLFPITSVGTGYFVGYGLSTTTNGSGTGLIIDLLSVSGGGLTYPTCAPPYNTPGIGGYTIRDFGSGYESGDIITIVQQTAISIVSGGTGYSTSSSLATTGGNGTGLTVNIYEVSSGVITAVGVNLTGSGYLVGDTVTISGGGNNATLDIMNVVSASGGQLTKSVLTKNQSQSYNVGIQVIPPTPPTGPSYPALQEAGPYWPPVTVIANDLDGNCAQAITYPNDTALPKSQVGYAQGSYIINIVDPTVIVID